MNRSLERVFVADEDMEALSREAIRTGSTYYAILDRLVREEGKRIRDRECIARGDEP